MDSQPIGQRRSLISGSVAALAVVFAPSTTSAQPDGRTLTIDGSSARSFEASNEQQAAEVVRQIRDIDTELAESAP
jgi:hypothetical protein